LKNPALRTLEDLRLAPEAAWLWDGARSRIVWANEAGIQLFDAQTVFDLVDRPFDRNEAGVRAVADLTTSLQVGERKTCLLHFPSTGQVAPMACLCNLHVLADGRVGVLVVMEPPRPQISAAPENLAGAAMAQLPMGLFVLNADGMILHSNAAGLALLGTGDIKALRDIVVPPERADVLLARLNGAELASGVETVKAALGQRAMRLTLSTIAGGQQRLISLMMEDVTDRRALEREMQAVPVAPPASTAAQAFEQLAKSLQATIQEQSTAPQVATKPAVELTVPPPPVSIVETPRAKIDVPQAIRLSLENTGEAIMISAKSGPVFATGRAATMLGYDSAEALVGDRDLWQRISDEVLRREAIHLPMATGGTTEVRIATSTIPWLNGPAEQYVIKAATPVKASVAVETTPVVAEAPAPVVAPVVETIAAPDGRDAIDASELKALLDVASDGIISLDGDSKILSFSAGAEAIFSHRESDVLGMRFADLLTADSQKLVRDYLAALDGPGLASVFNDGREVTAVVKQGGTVPLFLTVGKVQSPRSKAKFCAVVRDITQWKRTEQELREAKEKAENVSRQKSDFLARISHEIRTPLNAILGFSDVMRLQRFGEIKNEKYLAYANDIHTSGSHLLSLVNDLLDLSKVEAGKLELDFTAVSLIDTADHAMRILQAEAARQHIVIRKSIGASLPRVVADVRALRQVVLNLLSNAIKYTDAGGQVFLSAQADENGDVLLRVRDTGIGMTEHQLQDALQPFSRVDTPDRDRQGTGLGLPLTKALVEANRAAFAMTSEPGKGTLAEIRFPATRVLAE
jgi:PAS domain S-box-containing protein